MISTADGVEFEPYQGKTLTAELPETVYGGTVDWGAGVLTVDTYGKVFDGTETLLAYSPVVNGILFRLNPNISHVDLFSSWCTHFAFNSAGWNSQVTGQFKTVNPDYCVFRHDLYSTPDTFKVWLAEQYAAGTPVTVVYKLAEPYTIQLTPQQLEALKGTNTIWSDAGETEVTYAADIMMYIDKKIAAIAAAFFLARWLIRKFSKK